MMAGGLILSSPGTRLPMDRLYPFREYLLLSYNPSLQKVFANRLRRSNIMFSFAQSTAMLLALWLKKS
jgi:hypothetical protein